MNKTLNFTLALLALTGAAFAQNVNESFPRGSLLRQNNPGGVPADRQRQLSDEVRVANQRDFYKRGELLHRRSYQACMEKESRKQDANPYNCQNQMNIANYYAGMAGAIQRPQQQFDTTQSSQAMRDLLKQRYIPSMPLPPSQVGQRLPRMPRLADNRSRR